jgi:hypothetical protein
MAAQILRVAVVKSIPPWTIGSLSIFAANESDDIRPLLSAMSDELAMTIRLPQLERAIYERDPTLPSDLGI